MPHVQSIDIDPDIGASTFFDGVLDFLPVEIKHARIPYPPLEVLLAFLESSANARLESLELFAAKAQYISGTANAPECLSFQYSLFSVQTVRKAAKQRGLEIVEAGAPIGFRWEEDICTFITPSLSSVSSNHGSSQGQRSFETSNAFLPRRSARTVHLESLKNG